MKLSFKSFTEDESGALNEFIGFILFLLLVFGLLVPVAAELFLYTLQGAEVSRLAKIASQRACALMADSNIGSGGDLGQGGLGFGTDVSVMQFIVASVFENEAPAPDTYQTASGGSITFGIYDVLGKPIYTVDNAIVNLDNWKQNDNYMTVAYYDATGQRQDKEVLMAGTNMGMSLCPALTNATVPWLQPFKGTTRDWTWCMNPANDYILKEVITKYGTTTVEPNEEFVKNGNNGTVSCDTYCGSSGWPGGVGTCVKAVNSTTGGSVGCSQKVKGLQGLTCTCKGLPENPPDLIARMEKLQPGRANPDGGEPGREDFTGRIDKCSVCATKRRVSMFERTVFGTILGCGGQNTSTQSVLPCTITSCGSAKFVQPSGVKGYAPKYRDKMNLGGGIFVENSPNSLVDPLTYGLHPTKDAKTFFCAMNADNPNGKGIFNSATNEYECPN